MFLWNGGRYTVGGYHNIPENDKIWVISMITNSQFSDLNTL